MMPMMLHSQKAYYTQLNEKDNYTGVKLGL